MGSETILLDPDAPGTPDWAKERSAQLRALIEDLKARGWVAIEEAQARGDKVTILLVGSIRAGPSDRVTLTDVFMEGDGADALDALGDAQTKVAAFVAEKRAERAKN